MTREREREQNGGGARTFASAQPSALSIERVRETFRTSFLSVVCFTSALQRWFVASHEEKAGVCNA